MPLTFNRHSIFTIMTKASKDKTSLDDIQKQIDTLKKAKDFDGLQEQLKILVKVNNQAKIKKFSAICDILLFLQAHEKDAPEAALECLADAANILLKVESTPAKAKAQKPQKADPKENCFKYLKTACDVHGPKYPILYSLAFRFSTQPFYIRLEYLQKACLRNNQDGLSSLIEELKINSNVLRSKQSLDKALAIYTESKKGVNAAVTCLAVILYDAFLALPSDSFSELIFKAPAKEPIKQKVDELYRLLLTQNQLPDYLAIKAWDFFAKENQQNFFISHSKPLIDRLSGEAQANLVKYIAEYFDAQNDKDNAHNYYKRLCRIIDPKFPGYQSILSRLSELTRNTGRLAELTGSESLLGQADHSFEQALITFNEAAAQENLLKKIRPLRAACSELFQACLKEHQSEARTEKSYEALKFLRKQIFDLNKKETVKPDERYKLAFLNTTLIKVLAKIGIGKGQQDCKLKPYYYYKTDKKNELEDLKKTTRAHIENILPEAPPAFVEFAAELFLDEKIFPQDDHKDGRIFPQDDHIARNLLSNLNHTDASTKAKFILGKLCFLGQGGKTDLSTATKSLSTITECQEEFVAEANFILGQIYETEDFNLALGYYIKAAEENYKRAIYKLYLLHILKNNVPATIALFKLFKREMALDQSILKEMTFSHYPFPSEQIHLHLQKFLLEKKVDNILELTSEETQILQQSLQEKQAKEKNILGKRRAEIDQEIEQSKKIILDLNLVETTPDILALGLKLLTKQSDPRLLIKAATTSQDLHAAEAFLELKKHYQQAKDGIKIVLSMLCYEYLRANKNEKNLQVVLLKKLLLELEPNYREHSMDALRKKLIQIERVDNTYYDPCASDASDDEQALNFRKLAPQSKAHRGRPEELLKQISIKEIEKRLETYTKSEDAIEETTETDAIKRIFCTYKPKASSSHDSRIISDLAKLNALPLDKALGLITTDFVVMQARGLHFKPTAWSMEARRKFRRQLHQDKLDGTINQHPVFSHAVYHDANVTDFTSRDQEDLLALEFSAKLIQQRLTKLQELPPHTANDFQETDDKLLVNYFAKSYKFNNRNEQLQQLYTNNLDLFHRYLAWETKQENSIFINSYNHFVSTGDLPLHSLKYAYGIKPYAGHKDERLFQLWDKNGIAHRPYAGVVYLTLHPLEDYLNLPVNHVVSMNTSGKINIEEMIIHERETSFLGYLPGERIATEPHLAKYPSFDKPYSETFLHIYGLNETLYKKFQTLFKNSAPHTAKRRLAELLLGEFLCCYQNLCLIREAEETAIEKKKILIYRDIYGNFSLQPPENVAAHPNGDDHAKRKLRMLGAASIANRNGFFTPAIKRGHEEESREDLDKDLDRKITVDESGEQLGNEIIDQRLTQIYRDPLAEKGIALTPVFRFPGPNDLGNIFTAIMQEGKIDIESLSGEGIIPYTLEHTCSQILMPINFSNAHYGLAWFKFDAFNKLTHVECIESLSRADSEERWTGFLNELRKLNENVTVQFHHQDQQDDYSCGHYLLTNISDIVQKDNITPNLQLSPSEIDSLSTELTTHRDKRSCARMIRL
ncbi:MAG: hypothetical protein K0S08_1497 [Gammaproteobacteria bacterium]|jgi:hypothetical protein|nr:hypothetical protein [Gammaproteobacteria bacterium]